MTPLQFGYLLRGLATQADTETLGREALSAARDILIAAREMPARPMPPQLTQVTLGRFCLHNISVLERCPVCAKRAVEQLRFFALVLPKDTQAVYIRLGQQEEPNHGRLRDPDGGASAGRDDREAPAGEARDPGTVEGGAQGL